MGKLLDKLRAAHGAHQDSGVLFEALKKAHEEREAARQATEAIAEAIEAAGDPPAPAPDLPAAPDFLAAPPQPESAQRDARTAAIIALLLVAAALAGAVAWRGSVEIEERSGLKTDQAVDLKRSPQPGTAPAK